MLTTMFATALQLKSKWYMKSGAEGQLDVVKRRQSIAAQQLLLCH